MRGIQRQAISGNTPIKNSNAKAASIANLADTCIWYGGLAGVNLTRDGAQEYYNSLFKLYASWGVDFVKVDDISSPYHAKEIEAIRAAIDFCGREIVLSLSPGDETKYDKAAHLQANANMWRISSDFWDRWESLKHQFEICHQWEKYVGKGHWPDADMIPIGLLSRRGPEDIEHRTLFTAPEQKTLMTLWLIFRSPLIYGGDLTMMRPSELALLTNSEAIAVNQNSENNRQLFRTDNKVAGVEEIPGTKDKYLALFNLGETETQIEVTLNDLGINGECRIRDIWALKEIGSFSRSFKYILAPHSSGLFKILNAEN